jgi:hypothetical protein
MYRDISIVDMRRHTTYVPISVPKEVARDRQPGHEHGATAGSNACMWAPNSHTNNQWTISAVWQSAEESQL